MRKKIVLACLLAFSLTTSSALKAQEAEELQIFEFDYDHQNEAPLVNLPPTLQTPAPRGSIQPAQAGLPAPVQPVAAPPPAQPGVTVTVSPAQPGSPSTEVVVPGPVTVFVDDPLAAGQPGADNQLKVITIIGEPQGGAKQSSGPSALSEEELLETLFSPPGQNAIEAPAAVGRPEAATIRLSPSGVAPTTNVPAKPGEALVEKKGSSQPIVISPGISPSTVSVSKGSGRASVSPPARTAKPMATKKAASSKTAKAPAKRSVSQADADKRTPGGVLYPIYPGRTAADYRFWELAMANWSKVSGRPSPGQGSLSRAGAVYPIDQAIIPSAVPPRPTPKNFW